MCKEMAAPPTQGEGGTKIRISGPDQSPLVTTLLSETVKTFIIHARNLTLKPEST